MTAQEELDQEQDQAHRQEHDQEGDPGSDGPRNEGARQENATPPPVPEAVAAPPSSSVLSLNAMLEKLHASVVTQVRDNGDRAMEHLLAQYFPLDPQSGRMAPKTVRIPLPGPGGTPILREIPLFSLTNHQDVAIEALVIKLKAALVGSAEADGASELMLDFSPAEGGSRATAEIEIRFRGTPAAETIARINDIIVKRIGGEGG